MPRSGSRQRIDECLPAQPHLRDAMQLAMPGNSSSSIQLLTLHPRRCWTKRYSQPAPHRKIPAPGNDVELASKRCDESGLKGLPSAPEWGIPRRRATGRGGRCRCRSRSCAGPHRLPGQVDLTELRDGGVGNPGSSSWRQRPSRVFRVKVGGQFPSGAVLPPCPSTLPPLKKRATGHPGRPFSALAAPEALPGVGSSWQ